MKKFSLTLFLIILGLIPLLVVICAMGILTVNPARAENPITVYYQATVEGLDQGEYVGEIEPQLFQDEVSTTAVGYFTYDADVDLGEGFHPLLAFTFDPGPEAELSGTLDCDPITNCDSEGWGQYQPAQTAYPVVTPENLEIYLYDFDYVVYTPDTDPDDSFGYSQANAHGGWTVTEASLTPFVPVIRTYAFDTLLNGSDQEFNPVVDSSATVTFTYDANGPARTDGFLRLLAFTFSSAVEAELIPFLCVPLENCTDEPFYPGHGFYRPATPGTQPAQMDLYLVDFDFLVFGPATCSVPEEWPCPQEGDPYGYSYADAHGYWTFPQTFMMAPTPPELGYNDTDGDGIPDENDPDPDNFDADNDGLSDGDEVLGGTDPLNASPIADANGPYSADEGSAISLDGTGSSDPEGDPLNYNWSVDSALCTFDNDTSAIPNLTCSDGPNNFAVTLVVDDGQGTDSDTTNVTVFNVAPTATFESPTTVDEGSSFTLSLTGASDPSSADTEDGFTYAFDCGDGYEYGAFGESSSNGCPAQDDGYRTVRGRIQDKDGAESEYMDMVQVDNVAPDVGPITAPTDPVQVGIDITSTAAFTDVGQEDTHTAMWQWGDDSPNTSGTVTESDGSWSVTGTHTYTSAGVYEVLLTVTDDDGGSDSETFQYVVVYDPAGGFVSGAGMIDSPSSAYKPDLNLAGLAHFGFVSKYQRGTTAPTGNTDFRFHAAGLKFQSSSYDWLVVTGNDYARFKGVGTINRMGEYKFMVWAGDGNPDTFRIRIWEEDEQGVETTFYDNGMDQPIKVGSIIIHAR